MERTYTETQIRDSLGKWLWINNIEGSDGQIPNIDMYMTFLLKSSLKPISEDILEDPAEGLVCDSCQ